MEHLNNWWQQRAPLIFIKRIWMSIITWYIKIIHSKSSDSSCSSSRCSTHNRTISISAPYCSWETHRDSWDHRRSVSCRRAGHTWWFFLRTRWKRKKKFKMKFKNQIQTHESLCTVLDMSHVASATLGGQRYFNQLFSVNDLLNIQPNKFIERSEKLFFWFST